MCPRFVACQIDFKNAQALAGEFKATATSRINKVYSLSCVSNVIPGPHANPSRLASTSLPGAHVGKKGRLKAREEAGHLEQLGEVVEGAGLDDGGR